MKLPTLPSLEYNVTRQFTLAHLSLLIYAGGIIWTILITILNVAAVGYDVVSVYSTSFLNPAPLWYERFWGVKWLFPSSWSCNPTVIAPYQGHPLPIILMKSHLYQYRVRLVQSHCGDR
jgi:hypothetical protein